MAEKKTKNTRSLNLLAALLAAAMLLASVFLPGGLFGKSTEGAENFTALRICLPVLSGLLFASLILNAILQKQRRNSIDEERYRNEQVVDYLANDFGCVNYVNFLENKEEDRIVNYRTSSFLKQLVPGWEQEKNFHRKLDLLADLVASDRERELFLSQTRRETLIRELQNSDVYFVNTRFNAFGDPVYYQLKFSAVRSDDALTGIVVGLHSVDEQVKRDLAMQEKLEEALSMAQSASRAKTVFLNNMSHDIRTPMNAIIGYTALAQRHLEEPEKLRDYLDKISLSSNHLMSIINEVMDMSRIESGGVRLCEQPENIPGMMREIGDLIRTELEAKNHYFNLRLERLEHENVLCDKLRLRQVLLNLLSNAVKYTEPGGVITLIAEEKDEKNSACSSYDFFVADNGVGMDAAFLENVFEPFARETSSASGGAEGIGLGMSIARNLVELMGGRIFVRSMKGKGTEVRVSLSFLHAEDSGAEEKEAPAGAADLTAFRGKKILLVDDNELNREIAAEILEENGLAVTQLGSGREALEYVKKAGEGDCDLILMDVQMPEMDGFETTRRIRALGGERSRVPIVAMTANAFEEDRRAALEAGMDGHIAKPVNESKLWEKLSAFLS